MRRRLYRANRSILIEKGEAGFVDWSKGIAYFSREPSKYYREELEDAGYRIVVGVPPLRRKKHRMRKRRR